jgi:hypothetical protein
MPSEMQPQVVRSFLAQLDAALRDVPSEVSREIVAGVTEELAGLEAATAASRIEELGDPAFIAAEARAGVAAPAETPTRLRDPRWYVVVAGLLVAVGGIVVPIVGWIIGITLVWLSKTWCTWEKWVATLTPLVATAVAAVVAAVTYALFVPPEPLHAEWAGPTHPTNPVMPPFSDLVWSSILFLALVGVVVGIWVLWRGLRSHSGSDSGQLTRRER